MAIEIRHRYTVEVLKIVEANNLEGAYLEGANLRGAYLRGANLRRAYLEGANLEGANLEGAYLEGAYLEGANLEGANLRGANLRGAYLEGANLEALKGHWSSHDVVAEILRTSAGTDPLKRMMAGLILVSRDWCWDQFLGLSLPAELLSAREWALDTLTAYASSDNAEVPEVLRT